MKEKVKHHPWAIGSILGGVFYVAGIVLGLSVHISCWSLVVLGLALYLLFILWWDPRYELVCPSCGHTSWSKTNYYCATCGVRLVFKRRQKVKSGEKVKPGRVPEPCCSKGHRVYGFDKYCGKCGEKLTNN